MSNGRLTFQQQLPQNPYDLVANNYDSFICIYSEVFDFMKAMTMTNASNRMRKSFISVSICQPLSEMLLILFSFLRGNSFRNVISEGNIFPRKEETFHSIQFDLAYHLRIINGSNWHNIRDLFWVQKLKVEIIHFILYSKSFITCDENHLETKFTWKLPIKLFVIVCNLSESTSLTSILEVEFNVNGCIKLYLPLKVEVLKPIND